jgi:hypothetical protein
MAVHKANQMMQKLSNLPDTVEPEPELAQEEYSEEQFHADLAKAGNQIDAMAAKALQSLREGRVRKFPA